MLRGLNTISRTDHPCPFLLPRQLGEEEGGLLSWELPSFLLSFLLWLQEQVRLRQQIQLP